ncbi:MAG: ASCH domain-containing protein [Candidatus Nitrosopolaris sp.]
MKCLSLKQPYAELVAAGRKTIETRRWSTNFRGRFLIHSSKAIDKEISTLLNIDCSKLMKGAIIGVVCLHDV